MNGSTYETSTIAYSIIIPAYNAENTIERVIDSITNRLKSCEIIVVENGSTDNTSTLIENLCNRDSRVKLIHTPKGVSVARNAGIIKANGTWISFVDADDLWIANEESISTLTKDCSDADIISCSYFKDDSLIEHDFDYTERLIDKDLITEATVWMLRKPTKTMSVWAKFFKRDFLQNQELFFNEELRVSEDSEFLLRCMLKCKTAVVSKIPIYRYCSDTPSVIRSIDTTRTEGYLKALETVKCDLNDANKDLQEAFVDFTAAHLNLIGVHDVFNCNIKMPWKERVSRIKEIVGQELIQAEIDKLKRGRILSINNIPSYLFKKKMFTFGGAICYLRSAMNSAHRKNNKK